MVRIYALGDLYGIEAADDGIFLESGLAEVPVVRCNGEYLQRELDVKNDVCIENPVDEEAAYLIADGYTGALRGILSYDGPDKFTTVEAWELGECEAKVPEASVSVSTPFERRVACERGLTRISNR